MVDFLKLEAVNSKRIFFKQKYYALLYTPLRTTRIIGSKILKIKKKNGLEKIILKFHEPL